jgi:thiol:disulfide interchange protein
LEAGDTAGPAHLVKGYARGFQQAREQGKPMLVLFTAPECVYCRQMLTEVFTDQVIRNLSRQFVSIQVDAAEEPAVCRDFHVDVYPTIQFMTPQGIPLNRLIGKRSALQLALDMEVALEAATDRVASTPPREYR